MFALLQQSKNALIRLAASGPLVSLVASIVLASSALSQALDRPRVEKSDLTLARALDPRLQHALSVVASENRLQDITQLDRQAALASTRYSRRIQALNSITPAVASTTAKEIRELGSKSGLAERNLFLALKSERGSVNLAMKAGGAVSLIQPLNLACVEASRIIRLRVGSLATEVPELGETAVCRGDLVADRLIYRYCRAVTAEDDLEQTRALRDIQVQLACLSTRQIRAFEGALVEAVDWATTIIAPAADIGRQAAALRDAFRQTFAPLIFGTANASRLFRNYDQTGIIWLLKHKNMLASAAMRQGTVSNRVGLLFANRFSGDLRRFRAACAPGDPKIFDDGQGGRTCNPLGALFQSAALTCDPAQWTPSGSANVSAFICDPACGGLPGSGFERTFPGSRSLLDRFGGLRSSRSSARPPSQSSGRSTCTYAGPQTGTDSGPGSGSSGNQPSRGGDTCGLGTMFGLITQQSPMGAYNDAFTGCIRSMVADRNQTDPTLDETVSGYPPGGGAKCMVASPSSTPDSTTTPPPSTGAEPQPQEGNPDANLQWAKNVVNTVIEGFAGFINELFGSEVISQDAIKDAETAVNNAGFGDTGQCPGGNCTGDTSADGKTITIDKATCENSADCFNAVLHEAVHSAFSFSGVNDADLEHAVIGSESGETGRLFGYWAKSSSAKSCNPEDMTCSNDCTSREAAIPDCTRTALNAYLDRVREIRQAAKDCATDKCWSPNGDDTKSSQQCGNPDKCRGQSVALCTQEQPNCMCRNNDLGINAGAALRDTLWRAYCTRAQDDRCSSPNAPNDFAQTSKGPSGPRPSPVDSISALTLLGGKVTISSDGTLAIGRSSAVEPIGTTDSDCSSNNCRASQRGDW